MGDARRLHVISLRIAMDQRKKILLKIVGQANELITQLVDEVIFLEMQLENLKKLPFIKVNPKNNGQQKATPAAKQYKELLQQYTNRIKVLARISGQDEKEDDSPLRLWVASRNEGEKKMHHVNKKTDSMDSG